MKICFAASSGGHYEQIMMLKPLMNKYDSFIVTEKTKYTTEMTGNTIYYLLQVNRREWLFLLKMIVNSIISVYIYVRERPDIVITTGVLAIIPLCLICKAFGKQIIYIESFAKVTSLTKTGKLMYRIANQFYVQWPGLKDTYPNSIYVGGIY